MTIWLGVSYAERGFQAAILTMAAAMLISGRPGMRPGSIGLMVAAIMAWGPAQLIAGWTVYHYETATAALRWATLGAVFFLTREVLRDRKLFGQARTAIAAFGAVVAVLALTQAYTSQGRFFWLFPSEQSEVFGPFQNRNNYATFVELTLPLVLWEGLKQGPRRIVWLTMTGVMAASVIASASRAGSLLVVAEIPAVMVVALWRQLLSKQQFVATLAILAAASALGVAVTGWQALAGRFGDLDPLLYRREMLQSAIAMVRERPWTGFGLGTFPVAYPAYAVFDSGYVVNHAHNDWAEWAVEGGLPFLLLLGGLSVASSVAAVRSGWGLGLVAAYLHGLVDFPMQRTGLVIWLFIVGGALSCSFTDDSKSDPSVRLAPSFR
jgi:O-antigen ligase